MNQFIAYVADHSSVIIVAVGAIGSAAVVTMPPPGTTFNLYEWFYDFSHQFINSKNTRLSPAIIPTAPATKDEPKVEPAPLETK